MDGCASGCVGVRRCVGAWVHGAWVRGCVGAWVRGCVGGAVNLQLCILHTLQLTNTTRFPYDFERAECTT